MVLSLTCSRNTFSERTLRKLLPTSLARVEQYWILTNQAVFKRQTKNGCSLSNPVLASLNQLLSITSLISRLQGRERSRTQLNISERFLNLRELYTVCIWNNLYLHTTRGIITKGDWYYLQLQWPLKKKGRLCVRKHYLYLHTSHMAEQPLHRVSAGAEKTVYSFFPNYVKIIHHSSDSLALNTLIQPQKTTAVIKDCSSTSGSLLNSFFPFPL